MDPGGRHRWLFRRHFPCMALSPYSHGQSMLKKWLKAGYMEQRILYPTEAGTPQGGIVSPVLANMTLDGLERVLY